VRPFWTLPAWHHATICLRDVFFAIQRQGDNKMNFGDSIKTCFSNYANFNGRAARPEFWWFVLFLFLASLALNMVSGMLSGLFSLATLVPSLAVGARRLHDTNRSGWWQLLGLIPVIGWIVLIVFCAQPGETEDNQYGAVPTN